MREHLEIRQNGKLVEIYWRYDEKKKMFKEWDEYRVGGMLGRFAYYGNVIWKKE